MSYTDKTLGWGTGKSTMIFALFTILSLSFFGGIGMTFVSKAFGLTSPQGMRWLQFSISIGLFFMPPLLFAQYASNDPSRFLGLVKLPTFKVLNMHGKTLSLSRLYGTYTYHWHSFLLVHSSPLMLCPR